ncbi:hypothetical protein SAMN05892877_103383 [Rhizobium subbaraonis]|uniref:Uncharacterized protein n=1 Tax=Rhizobium subbaraonis TaxID=908946 RepID=A0A285U5D4_9HYPH|nr:hypothetical protein [Rhizobium subbaraonis]SOC37039.1 hypothetical protein SAMN05892877_103383 [Rhizobium subbaraonis]
MADRPILFSAPMVRALLDGRKTQTRRVINFANIEKVLDFVKVATDAAGHAVYEMKGADDQFVTRPASKGLVDYHFSPRIAVGDRLYVREAWRVAQRWNGTAPRDLSPRTMTVFGEAGGSIANQDSRDDWRPSAWPELGNLPAWAGKFRQAMHMPRWASRITLLVDDIKVERLQDLSEQDAFAEGVWHGGTFNRFADDLAASAIPGRWFPTATDWYRDLWKRLNGPGSWAANPWVVAYTFRVVMGNIDEIGSGDG